MEDIQDQDRLLPRIIDIRAKETPGRTFCFVPKGQQFQDGFSPISYAVFAKAVDKAAWWIDSVLDGKVRSKDFPTIPYIGCNDLRYALLLYACMKTSRKLMVPLSSNTAEAQVKLLKDEKCTVALASREHVDDWATAQAAMKSLRLIEVPELSWFLDNMSIDQYTYEKTYREAMHDPAWTIQTSGTTGTPRPLDYTNHNVLITVGNFSDDKSLAMPSLLRDCYFLNLLPMSWGAGLLAVAVWPLMLETIPIVLPSSMPQPMTPEYAVEAMTFAPRGAKNGLIFVPTVLQALARNASLLPALRQCDWVGYAGAPLDYPTGDLIAEYTRVQSFLGSTEVSMFPLLLNDPADWKIHRFHPTLLRFHFEHFQHDLYELCVGRLPDDPRPCFATVPAISTFHTKDLWRKAPGREAEGFWMTAGRVDDFVKLASLTKFNAIEVEQILDRHPLIEKSLVAGDGRPRPFSIVQLRGVDVATTSRRDILEQIWAAFEAANAHIFEEARLTKELTIIAGTSMPLQQTAKGTVNRLNTIKMFQGQIEDAYSRAQLAWINSL